MMIEEVMLCYKVGKRHVLLLTHCQVLVENHATRNKNKENFLIFLKFLLSNEYMILQ